MRRKVVYWVTSSRRDLRELPAAVQDVFGYALYLAQCGSSHPHAKALRGFGGAGVIEVVEAHRGDAYRAVYTLSVPGAVYVLHCFQKKSVQGRQTPLQDMRLIRERLKAALAHAAEQANE